MKVRRFLKRTPDEIYRGSARIIIGRRKPVIDKTYKLDQFREAVRYLETGHARGKLVVTLE